MGEHANFGGGFHPDEDESRVSIHKEIPPHTWKDLPPEVVEQLLKQATSMSPGELAASQCPHCRDEMPPSEYYEDDSHLYPDFPYADEISDPRKKKLVSDHPYGHYEHDDVPGRYSLGPRTCPTCGKTADEHPRMDFHPDCPTCQAIAKFDTIQPGWKQELDRRRELTQPFKHYDRIPKHYECRECPFEGNHEEIDQHRQETDHYKMPITVAHCPCGDTVSCHGFTSTCDTCGRDYGGNGNLLAPRSQWGAETGESWRDVMRVDEEEPGYFLDHPDEENVPLILHRDTGVENLPRPSNLKDLRHHFNQFHGHEPYIGADNEKDWLAGLGKVHDAYHADDEEPTHMHAPISESYTTAPMKMESSADNIWEKKPYDDDARKNVEEGVLHERVKNKIGDTLMNKGRWSPLMAAMAGHILDQHWTNPRIVSLAVTSDGFLLGNHSDDGHQQFFGSYDDLAQNWGRLTDAAELTADEKAHATKCFNRRVEDNYRFSRKQAGDQWRDLVHDGIHPDLPHHCNDPNCSQCARLVADGSGDSVAPGNMNAWVPNRNALGHDDAVLRAHLDELKGPALFSHLEEDHGWNQSDEMDDLIFSRALMQHNDIDKAMTALHHVKHLDAKTSHTLERRGNFTRLSDEEYFQHDHCGYCGAHQHSTEEHEHLEPAFCEKCGARDHNTEEHGDCEYCGRRHNTDEHEDEPSDEDAYIAQEDYGERKWRAQLMEQAVDPMGRLLKNDDHRSLGDHETEVHALHALHHAVEQSGFFPNVWRENRYFPDNISKEFYKAHDEWKKDPEKWLEDNLEDEDWLTHHIQSLKGHDQNVYYGDPSEIHKELHSYQGLKDTAEEGYDVHAHDPENIRKFHKVPGPMKEGSQIPPRDHDGEGKDENHVSDIAGESEGGRGGSSDGGSTSTASKQSNILDPIQRDAQGTLTLDPAVFTHPTSPNPHMKDSTRHWIRRQVYSALYHAGYNNPERYIKLVMTGSLTTYQYQPGHSDADISIWPQLTNMPEWDHAKLIKICQDALDGKNLPGTEYPLQTYVMDPETTSPDIVYVPGLRSAYDLDADRWVVPPDTGRVHDFAFEYPDYFHHAQQVAEKMRQLIQYHPERVKTYWKRVHKKRRESQLRGEGDFSQANADYKAIENAGLVPDISRITGMYIASMTEMDQAFEHLKQSGGFTLHPNTGRSPKGPGFMVARPDISEVLPFAEVTPQRLDTFASTHQHQWNVRGHYMGGWWWQPEDQGDNNVYLDASVKIVDPTRAHEARKKWDQTSIYRLPGTYGQDDEGGLEYACEDPMDPAYGIHKHSAKPPHIHRIYLDHTTPEEAAQDLLAALHQSQPPSGRRSHRAQPEPHPHPASEASSPAIPPTRGAAQSRATDLQGTGESKGKDPSASSYPYDTRAKMGMNLTQMCEACNGGLALGSQNCPFCKGTGEIYLAPEARQHFLDRYVNPS